MWFSRSVAVFCLVLPGFAIAESFQSSIDPTAVAEVKATTQEKYLTSREAYDLLRERPNILFIDVRDPVEIAVSGHPELIDAIVPVRAQSTEFDDELLQWRLKDNPDFLMYMDDLLAKSGKTKHDMIIVTCGSGMRSAQAANKLYEA